MQVAIIDNVESILFMQDPHPIADAPAANANGAVVGLIAVAVISIKVIAKLKIITQTEK